MRRIGIMGGTFNPIHNGHLAIAKKAREQFLLEKVLFMPSGVPYTKNLREVLPVDIRCEMTALAIADTPYFELSMLEAADAERGKNTYTFETLQKLRRADPDADYYFILGADSLYTIENWKNPLLIFENCSLLVAVRRNDETLEKPQRDSTFSQESLHKQVLYLREKYRVSVEILEFAGMDLSSTMIREKLRCGNSVCGLVPKAVEDYILKNECYR